MRLLAHCASARMPQPCEDGRLCELRVGCKNYGQGAYALHIKHKKHLLTWYSLAVKLNANRSVTGVLRGYDQFMNVVLDHTQGLFSCKSSSESELSFNWLFIVLHVGTHVYD